MIIIKNFGWRLGNQLFQIATAVAISERDGGHVNFPTWKYADIFEGDFSLIDRPSVYKEWQEPGFHYVDIPIGTTAINGYFQSEKYFKKYENKIREIFTIKSEIKDSIYEKHKDLLNRNNVVSVHLRRGDYLNYPDHHPVMDLNYFMKAMKKFPKDSIFLVFSDDPQWCKQNFPGIDEKFFIIEGQTDIEDFTMMTMCNHNCIANSSFSWWAAWLNNNPDKIVVAPKKWFGPAYANYDTKDLCCEGWVVI